jgi:hypothetical protein
VDVPRVLAADDEPRLEGVELPDPVRGRRARPADRGLVAERALEEVRDGGVTSSRRSEKGGGSQPCRRASCPKAKIPSRIAASTGTTRSGCRPAKGCRPMKRSWKISTARPKRSWSGVLWTLSSLWCWSSGGVKSGTPTRQG